MRIMIWHVHGGWMNSFMRGDHEYVMPHTSIDAAAPATADALLRDADIDVVVLQRLEEIVLAERLLGRVPGRDIPAIFLEHNTPKNKPVTERHALADQHDIPIVHVTHFNRIAWDCGTARTEVIEHGIVDVGPQYTGELPSLGVVINEPVRRGRITGTDLLPRFAEAARLDCFGIDTDQLPDALHLPPQQLQVVGDLPTAQLHSELARRRVYVHPMRWTSLGLSLLEAMTLGMPVVVLAATEAQRAVPRAAGAVSADVDELCAVAARLVADPDAARERGKFARYYAQQHYGLERFLERWNTLLTELTVDFRRTWGMKNRSTGQTGGQAPPAPLENAQDLSQPA